MKRLAYLPRPSTCALALALAGTASPLTMDAASTTALARVALAAIGEATPDDERPSFTTRPLNLTVTVVWTGRSLERFNLEALDRLRSDFSGLPFTHFVSPAYFLRGDAQAEAARKAILAAIRPGDHLGVRLGSWRSIVQASGVIFRNGPTFFGHALTAEDCAKDCAEEVPLHLYPSPDLDKIMRTSRDILVAAGLGRPTSFSVEGWVSSPALQASAAAHGFKYDFSAIAPEVLEPRLRHFPVFEWVKGLHGTLKIGADPFVVPTPEGSLTAFPISVSADLHSAKEMLDAFVTVATAHKQDPEGHSAFQLVLHQETAFKVRPAVTAALQDLFRHAHEARVGLRPLPLPAVEDAFADHAPVIEHPQVGPNVSH